jgi:hypothetical protein
VVVTGRCRSAGGTPGASRVDAVECRGYRPDRVGRQRWQCGAFDIPILFVVHRVTGRIKVGDRTPEYRREPGDRARFWHLFSFLDPFNVDGRHSGPLCYLAVCEFADVSVAPEPGRREHPPRGVWAGAVPSVGGRQIVRDRVCQRGGVAVGCSVAFRPPYGRLRPPRGGALPGAWRSVRVGRLGRAGWVGGVAVLAGG